MWASFIVTILLSFHKLDTILLWSLGHQDDCMSLAGNTYQSILPVYLKKKRHCVQYPRRVWFQARTSILDIRSCQ